MIHILLSHIVLYEKKVYKGEIQCLCFLWNKLNVGILVKPIDWSNKWKRNCFRL